MMFKLTLTTLIALTPSLSASATLLNICDPILRAAHTRMIEMTQNILAYESSAPYSFLRTFLSSLDSPLFPVLSQKQIDNILAILATLNLDPKRTGAEFTDFERGVGVALTQISPNGMEGALIALSAVFSPERAQAILDAIVEDV